jgi:fructokinase
MSESYRYPVVCFGEVLWDILPSGPLPGGAPMNVAYHLKKLGNNPALITKVGLDKYGEDLTNILTNSKIVTSFLSVDAENPTGLVYANVNDHQEVVYDIVYPSAWDFIEWNSKMEEVVSAAEYFVYGSLTSRNKTSRDTLSRLLERTRTKVLDINLRPPHFHRSSVEYLLKKANIVKMNILELELITGWFSTFHTTEERIKLMQDEFDLEMLIVTMGGDGALINHKGSVSFHPGFKVNVADTIGSGDAFLAGFLHKLLENESIENALAFASGIGAFIATQSGACPDYEIRQVTDLINFNSSTKLETQS